MSPPHDGDIHKAAYVVHHWKVTERQEEKNSSAESEIFHSPRSALTSSVLDCRCSEGLGHQDHFGHIDAYEEGNCPSEVRRQLPYFKTWTL